jgi:RNA binding exosome subunit
MANYTISEKISGHKAEQLFKAGRSSLEELKMEIVKDRSIAFLLQARTTDRDDVINVNFIVNAFQNECSLALTSETAVHETLKVLAGQFIDALRRQLNEV